MVEVRGQGFLRGLKLCDPVNDIQNELEKNKVLFVAAAENVLRLLPPLTVSIDEIDIAISALKEVANTPGMSQWDVQRAQAAVKAQEAKMAGTEYDLQHALNTINQNKAYEEAGGEPNKSGRTWDGH